MKKTKEKYKLIIIIQIVLYIIVFICVFKIFIWMKENNQNNKINKAVSENVKIDETKDILDKSKYIVDINLLKKINKNTIAWLKVENTKIESPVLKTSNNSFYLEHGFDDKINSAGWIFADYRNKFDDLEKNIIIYGHNRKDGSMFSSLKNTLSDKWYNNENNHIITLVTSTNTYKYKVFSIYEIKNEDYYLKTIFNSDNEFLDFANKIKNRSIKDFNINLNEKDKILTLSTCADNSNYRIVLHAKLIN